MRALKRFVKKQKKIHRAKKYVSQTKDQLEHLFAKKIRLSLKGGAGRDLVYIVIDKTSNKRIAVLRVGIDGNKEYVEKPNRPYTQLSAKQTIEREHEIYLKLSQNNLSPKPIWMSDDHNVLCNEYLDATNFFEHINHDQSAFWDYALKAAQSIQKLHNANVTHMDMSFHNILIDRESNLYFIDFEYVSGKKMNVMEQRLYDYLRLIESYYKFLPEKIIYSDGLHAYLKNLEEIFADCNDLNETSLDKFSESIMRISKNKHFNETLHKLTQ